MNFTLKKVHQNNVVFNIINGTQKYIKIQDLMRIFVTVPQFSKFANELNLIV